jgi:NADH-ubiquinone oxidoreductase chain 4
MGVLVITFSCQSILLFYVMFEASLIPLFFLILGWGVQPERLQAGIYFLLYTLVGSLPLLVSFIYLYGQRGRSLWGR